MYGTRFYEEHNGAESGYARLADHIYERAKPASVCDLGCGNAFLLCFLAQKGVQVRGLESSSVALQFAEPSIREEILVADVTQPHDFGVYDLVIATEVAEHNPRQASSIFVSNVARSARRHIVFTAAGPGQWGDGHINCQPRKFWIHLFAEQGRAYDRQAAQEFTTGGEKRTGNSRDIAVDGQEFLFSFLKTPLSAAMASRGEV